MSYSTNDAGQLTWKGQTAEDYRRMAQDARRRSYESFERCDTDGFLSQAASDASAREYDWQAQLLDDGGTDLFPALFDLSGNLVPAKKIETRYGMRWMLIDPDKPRGQALGWFGESYAEDDAKAIATNARKGFYVGTVRVPAKAKLGGGWSWTVYSARLDDGWDPAAVVVDNGQGGDDVSEVSDSASGVEYGQEVGNEEGGKIMSGATRTHKLSDAQVNVLTGPRIWNADGSCALTSGRENTLAALRRLGVLNGRLLTIAGNAVRLSAENGERSVTVPKSGESETFYAAQAAQADAAPAEDAHRRCEHRKTLRADHDTACPVWTDGVENKGCQCWASDAQCEELSAPAEAPAPDAMTDTNGMPTDAAWARHGELMDALPTVFLPMVGQTRIDPVTGHRYVVKAVRHRAPRRFQAPTVTVSGEVIDSVITPTSAGGTRTTYGSHASEIFYMVPDETPLAVPAPQNATQDADTFDMSNLTDAQTAVLETNLGRVPEVIKAAQDVCGTALVAFDGALSHAARVHHVTYYREATATLGADVDPAAYSSAVCNANDTAREEGFPYMSAEWFACLDSSYECMREENETARQRAEHYAAQDAEDAAAYAAMLTATHVLRFEGDARVLCGERIDRREYSEGILRVDVDPTRADCPECVRQAETLAAWDAQDGPTDDECHAAALLAAVEAAERSAGLTTAQAYPRTTEDGRTVWACCESSIGAACQHVTVSPVSLALKTLPNGRVLASVGGHTKEFAGNRATAMHAAFWAHSVGYAPTAGRKFKWSTVRGTKIMSAPARAL